MEYHVKHTLTKIRELGLNHAQWNKTTCDPGVTGFNYQKYIVSIHATWSGNSLTLCTESSRHCLRQQSS